MSYWYHVINISLLVAMLAVSLNLLTGLAGMVSLAHGALYGVAGYSAAIASVDAELRFPITIFVAMGVTGAIGALTAWPALRVRGEYLILLTLAVQFMLHQTFESWTSVTGGTSGYPGVFRPMWFNKVMVEPIDYLPLIGGVAVLVLAAGIVISRSSVGRVLRAVRDDESATIGAGHSVTRYKLIAFTLSGMIAGVAGALYAHYQVYLSPSVFTLEQSIFVISAIVLGGAGNMLGAALGGAALAALPEVLRFWDVGESTVGIFQKGVYGALLMAFMLFRPQGLIPERRPRSGLVPASGSASGSVSASASAGAPPAAAPDGALPEGALPDDASPDDASPDGATVRVASSDGETARRAGAAVDEPPIDLDAAVPEAAASQTGGRLTARGLNKRFGGVVVADDIDIELLPGRVTALVGPNGAGKTTLFNLLTGAIRPESGIVEIDGRRIDNIAPWRRVRAGLSRTFQDVRLFDDLSVADNVAVPFADVPIVERLRRWPSSTSERVGEALDFVGLRDLADVRAGDLGFGQQKLVSLARALAGRPRVLLLDEPMSGIDRSWVDELLTLIERLAASGMTICLVEHNLEVVKRSASHAYFMDTGRIVAEGTPAELMADPELESVYFGRQR